MKTRARLSLLVVLGLVSAALSVVLTSPAQSSPGLGKSTHAGKVAARARHRGFVTLSAPIVQPGSRPAASRRANLTGTVRFKPRRKGRPVVIQRALGRKWRKVAKQRQNRRGVVTFTGPATNRRGKPFRYRGVAVRWRGNRKVVSNVRSSGIWSEAFRDEFSGNTLGAQWADRAIQSSSRSCSHVGHPGARSVGGGTLTLEVEPDPARPLRTCLVDGKLYRYYRNGQVSTQHLGDAGAFTYGTYAARIKFQQDRGQHGSFWMQPLEPGDDRGNAAESGAEIDVAEFFGRGYAKGGLASFLYNYGVLDTDDDPVKIGGLSRTATKMLPRRDAWWKRYHVFSVQWTPRYYSFMVDGREHFRTKRGVSGVPEYLILSLLSSDWELADRPSGTATSRMQVDWVRAWQQ